MKKIANRATVLTIAAIVLVTAFIMIILGPGGASSEKTGQPADPKITNKADAGADIREVDSLANNPPAVGSFLVVRGVVAAIKNDESVFALIDSCELEACDTTTTCAKFRLPVRCRGHVPKVGQSVIVRGRITRTPTGLIIEAEEVTTP